MSTYVPTRLQCLFEPLVLMGFFLVAHLSLHTLSFLKSLLFQPAPPTEASKSIPTSTLPKNSSPSSLAYGLAFTMLAPVFYSWEALGQLPDIVPQASGTILEIGPGAGTQVPRYDRSKVKKVIGVEVNEICRGELEQVLRRGGWNVAKDEKEGGVDKKVDSKGTAQVNGEEKGKKEEGEYVIVGASVEVWLEERVSSIEVARKEGREKEAEELMFDSVLAAQVLCSVNSPERVCRDLYKVLKPGGKMVVVEHADCLTSGGRRIQSFYNAFGWPNLIGGCNLGRPTQRYLLEAGKWEKVDLKRANDHLPWFILPKVYGTMVKA